jgi:hypothetical protein
MITIQYDTICFCISLFCCCVTWLGAFGWVLPFLTKLFLLNFVTVFFPLLGFCFGVFGFLCVCEKIFGLSVLGSVPKIFYDSFMISLTL